MEPPASSTMVIESNMTPDTGKLKGGVNILKERTRSNNNVFTYYVVLVTFSTKERISILDTDRLT